MYSLAARSRASAVLALFLATACTDRHPAGAPPGPELPPSALAMMTCTVSVRAGTVACAQAGAGSGASSAILGGQGTNVRLTSSGMTYDAGVFRMNVTVENLTAQAMGTADGVTPSAEGVRVFFQHGPTASVGHGTVTVANADGEAIFITAAQKYFQYDGILAPGDTTAPKEWRFNVPGTVTSFSFGVYVAGPVRAEQGWIGMAPIAGAVAVGDTQRITATVRSLTGGAVGGAVTWTTSNPAIGTVDANGVVAGVAAGTVTITATSGARTGSVEVRVHAPTLHPPPTFLAFQVDSANVTSGLPVDSVWYRLRYRDTGGFSPYIRVLVRHPSGVQRECVSHSGFGWVGDTREYRCVSGFADGSLGGPWRIERIEFSGRTISHAALLAAGAPAYVHVYTAVEDRDAPTLDSMTIQFDTVDAASGSGSGLRLWARDRMWTDQAEAFISSAGNPRMRLIGHSGTGENGVTPYHFPAPIPYYYHGGTFTLDSLRLRDSNGNRRTIPRDSLTARGFRTQFVVVNTAPDTMAPAFSAFSFTPDTVVGNGADTVIVTLAAEETIDESGVWFLDMEFERVSDPTQRRRCVMNASLREWYREMICPLTFSAAEVGTWRVRYVRAIDYMNNSVVGWTADLQALGIPVDLVVAEP